MNYITRTVTGMVLLPVGVESSYTAAISWPCPAGSSACVLVVGVEALIGLVGIVLGSVFLAYGALEIRRIRATHVPTPARFALSNQDGQELGESTLHWISRSGWHRTTVALPLVLALWLGGFTWYLAIASGVNSTLAAETIAPLAVAFGVLFTITIWAGAARAIAAAESGVFLMRGYTRVKVAWENLTRPPSLTPSWGLVRFDFDHPLRFLTYSEPGMSLSPEQARAILTHPKWQGGPVPPPVAERIGLATSERPLPSSTQA